MSGLEKKGGRFLHKSKSKGKMLDRNNINARSLDGLDPILKGSVKLEPMKTLPQTIMENKKVSLSKIESKMTLQPKGQTERRGYTDKIRLNIEESRKL